MTSLATDYERDGYYFPIDVMTEETALGYRNMVETTYTEYEDQPELKKILGGQAFVVLDFVDEILRSDAVLEPVKAVLGPDVMALGGSFFIKEPHSPNFVSWHQDLTYWGLDDASEVTAWIALSHATRASGCMQFVPGSHQRNIVVHRDTFADENMLSRGQELAVDVSNETTVDVALRPGQMSLHHGHIFHGSPPNESDDRRIGLALRFITPAMSQTSGVKTFARLVAGEDNYGNFQELRSPVGIMAPADIALARMATELQESIRFADADDAGKRTTT